MRRWLWWTAVLLNAKAGWAGVSAPLPVGGEFQVNSFTTGVQYRPAIAMDGSGAFVVLWTSEGSATTDVDELSVQGQRFAADGSPVNGQFQVNTYTTGYQVRPKVAMKSTGEFVVVWQSAGSVADSSYSSILGQRYAASGSNLGGEFQVNSLTTNDQQYPDVAMDAAGIFEVVWDSPVAAGGDSSPRSIEAKRFTAGGAGGAEFQVNSYTTNSQSLPAISMKPDGNLVVAWESLGSSGGDTSFSSIHGRRIESDGVPGAEFQINSYTTSTQSDAAIAVDPAGNFVVVWRSNGSAGSDHSYTSIQARRFAPDATPRGSDFQVNSYTTSFQDEATVAIDVDGDFVVVWRSAGPGADDSTQGQRFAASGAFLGGQFQVSTSPAGSAGAGLAFDSNGDFVATWAASSSLGTDTSGDSIQAQRFRVTGDLVGTVFLDVNANGLQNAGELGIQGVEVELLDETSTVRRTSTTDPLGNYRLYPKEGSWVLHFVAPPGAFTTANVGTDDTIDSDAEPATGETSPFPVSINVLDTTIDAGLTRLPLFWDGFESGSTNQWSAQVASAN